MKDNIKSLLAILMVILVGTAVTGCSKEDPFYIDNEANGNGTLSLKKMLVEVTNKEKLVRSDVNLDNFNVKVLNAEGLEVESYKYAEMPDVITLPVGNYTVKVNSGDVQEAAWDAPYFEGVSEEFSIKADDITEINTIVCKLANVRVTIKYEDALKAKMGPDCKVNVLVGNSGSLDFTANETRSGYFRYVPESTTLVASFSGTVDGSFEVNNFLTKTDVAPGNHYIITYTLKGITGNVPDLTGGANPIVGVDSSITVKDLTVDVTPDDNYLEDDLRPSEGDDEPGPGPGPVGNAPAVNVDAPLDIHSDNVVKDGDKVIIRATSEAEGGFTGFTVTIDSKILSPDVLEGVGLTDKLDLINPGQYNEKLNGLGFPTGNDVKGKKEFYADISQFIPMMGVLGAGKHNFILTVSDGNGTTIETLTLVIE